MIGGKIGGGAPPRLPSAIYDALQGLEKKKKKGGIESAPKDYKQPKWNEINNNKNIYICIINKEKNYWLVWKNSQSFIFLIFIKYFIFLMIRNQEGAIKS